MRLAVILTVVGLSLLAAPTAGAVRSEYFGIAQIANRLEAADIQGMQDAKVRTERFMLQWSSIEPIQGSYNWAATDAFVGDLASHGIRPVPFVWGSPGWVSDRLARPPLDSAAEEQAWQAFLRAAVARYGTNGTYWASGGVYEQDHPGAAKFPIKAWQIWNEPNLAKYFLPSPSAVKYARLLQISHSAIKSQDSSALIVLAGLVGSADIKAWTFLDNLYGQGAAPNFEVAALHPYGSDRTREINAITQFRGVMTQHSDGATQLWLTEVAWGSDPPDQFGINKGLEGQELLLRQTFNDILTNRKAWNLQRIFWFYWRDPATHPPGTCSFCSSAGLLRYNFTAKPAYDTFVRFTTDQPVASITSGPSAGGFTKDSTPTFSFTSSKPGLPTIVPGSTYVCRFDAQAFSPCSSPFTRASALSNGAHTFYVKAIDANGNESVVRSRSFTVDTIAPQTTITSGPSGATTDTTPTFTFASSESGSTFKCRFDAQAFAACSGPGASHTPSTALSPGTHTFRVRATDRALNTDQTPAERTFTVAP